MMDVNPVALRLSGYEKEELLNKQLSRRSQKAGRGLLRMKVRSSNLSLLTRSSMFNIVIAWLILDIVAVLIVLHDYHHWYRKVEPINDEENISCQTVCGR